MNASTWAYHGEDGQRIVVQEWLPAADIPVKAAVQIAHGMAETAGRYAELARRLTDSGYAVMAADHRGHGLTAGKPADVGQLGEQCFDRMAEDMGWLTVHIGRKLPGRPIYLLGHSMGSFLTQQYMYRFPGRVAGVILSGTNGPQRPLMTAGLMLSKLVSAVQGDAHRSRLLAALSFGAYNRRFRPNRTSFDWLSRDVLEVEKYVQDPYCGRVLPAAFWRGFFRGLLALHTPDYLARIPVSLPVYLMSGSKDPVGRSGKGVKQLADHYRRLGLRDVEIRLYEEGRHEMLHEVNRAEVFEHIADWLDRHVNGVPQH